MIARGPHRLAQASTIDCEVLIVGSGAGGAVIADVLTRAGRDVVMIEEGPYIDHENAPSSVPQSVSRLWRNGGITVAMGTPPIAYAEGRCVGGSTEINSAIFQRTPGELLDRWGADYHIDDFGESALRPYYEYAESIVNASITAPPFGAVSEVLEQGARKLGWQVETLARAQRECVGTNLCAAACPTGGKQSMTATLIPAALARGLRLIAQCRARRLWRDGGRVLGVKAVAHDVYGTHYIVTIRARTVFLCAGAIHTPALLQRSGIRDNVGTQLRLHPTIRLLALFDRELDAHLSRLPLYAVTEFMPEQRFGGSFFLPGFFGMSLAEDWPQRAWLLPHWRRCGSYYAMVRSHGSGTVRSLPVGTEPLVRYQLDDRDWRNLGQGAARLARLLFAAGATHVYPSVSGHAGWTDASQCDEWMETDLPRKRTNLMSIHLFGSCVPGADRARCATDSYGRVYEMDNLIVADASQIPEAPGVNPQATVMALARRAAEAYLARGDSQRTR